MKTDESSTQISVLLHHGFRYAISLTHDKHQAEDILQDAWVAVMQADGSLSKAYLFSAIRSRFFNANKREKLVSVVSLDELGELEDASYTAEMEFTVSEPALELALAQLRGVEREVLFLVAIEGYTAQEVADLTHRSRGTVLSLLYRSRKKIRHFIKQHIAKALP